MKFFPSMKFELHTEKSKESVLQLLSFNTKPEAINTFNYYKTHNKMFSGIINDDSFDIAKSITYRSSFVPLVSGKVIDNNDGCIIYMNMQLSSFAKVFMIIYTVFCLLFSTFMVLLIINEALFDISMLIPILLFLFMYAMTYFAFSYEVKKIKKALIHMFRGKEKNEKH